jgi:hypothetical protein
MPLQRSMPVLRWLRLVSLLSAAYLNAYCSRAPRATARPSDTVQAIDSTDSVARRNWSETARYRQLLRATLTAKDKKSVVQQTGCEIRRVFRKLGENEGDAALNQAMLRTYRTQAESLARSHTDSELAFQEIVALKDAACDSIRATWAPLDTSDDRYSDSHPKTLSSPRTPSARAAPHP